jgi:hypothetical protein
MSSIFLYIGPGLGVATIIIVALVFLIILASLVMILMTPLKRLLKRFKTSDKK